MTSTQELIVMAQKRAAEDAEHEYTHVPDFQPHTWVWLALRDAYNAGIEESAHLSNPPEVPDSSAQPEPVAQGEAIGAIEACNRLDLLLDAYEHEVTGDTLHDKDWLVRDFINDTRVREVFEALYATPTIPTGHRVVPVAEVVTDPQSGHRQLVTYFENGELPVVGTKLYAAPDAGGV